MKQKRHNKKVINWHRSLRSWRRRGWYRRQQEAIYDPAVAPEENLTAADLYCFDGADAYWDAYNPDSCPCCRGDRRRDDSDDLYRVALSNLLEHLLGRPRLELPRPSQPLGLSVERADEPVRQPVATDVTGTIETRLHLFVEQLVALNNENAALLRRRIDDCVDRRDIERLKHAAGELGEYFVKQVCLFAPFFLRHPRAWRGGHRRSLLDHLFVRHRVPEFLYQDWYDEREEPRLKWLCWFLLLAQGGSLKRAASLFGWTVSARFSHYLPEVPADLSPIEGSVFAEVRALGGSELDFERLIRNRAFVIDPTQPCADPAQAVFWHDTVRWLIRNSEVIEEVEWNFILPWAMHEFTEGQRPGARPFSWKGRSARAVIERARRYHLIFQNPYLYHRWAAHGWDWQWQDNQGSTWSFVELTSGEELFAEGIALHHCVAGYSGRCVLGQSAIVSLTRDGQPCMTVELDPVTLSILQARGLANREADAQEQRVIGLWVKAILLKPSTS